MPNKNQKIYITPKVKMRFDFAKKRVVILCETENRKTIDLEVDFETLEKMREEIRRQLESD